MSSDLAGAAVMVRALRAGRTAATAGDPATVCPYDPAAEDRVERAQALMWLRGYDRANPAPVDYSG